ncbi:MAG: aminopeptidase [Candidatus Eremiobacteraeota bacterium]|nr:aminopeptidase [Candidatus Eremiobacteraeota bacterium]
MTRRLSSAVALVSWLLGTVVMAPSARADSSTVDLNTVAKNVVQIAQVQENQIVLLTSDPTNFPFLEDLAVAVRAAGAFPLIWVTSDNYNQRMYSDVPAKYDSQSPLMLLGLYKMIDTQINVDYGGDQDYNFFAAADQNRLAAQAKANAPALQMFLSGHRHYVEVGNGIFPNPPNAALFGVSQSSLSDAFWTAMNTDYAKVQANADALKSAISAGSTMRVTSPNGTDISFGVKGTRFIVSAGSISANCAGINCYTALPAGDLYVIPLPGTATGKVVFDNTFWGKDNLRGFTATFNAGKLVSMTSSSDMTKVNAAYAAGGGGRDMFSIVDIGVNGAVKDIPNSLMLATFAAGSVSLGFGGDLGFGGTNASAFSFLGTQPGTTVTIDGKPIINNGMLATR